MFGVCIGPCFLHSQSNGKDKKARPRVREEDEMKILDYFADVEMKSESVNDLGNRIERYFLPSDRYRYDFDLCSSKEGWKQYDTQQDASYFGVWVHPEKMMTVTYCEGDVSFVFCKDEDSYHAELSSMAEFYGDPPYAAVSFGPEGTTYYYDERPV